MPGRVTRRSQSLLRAAVLLAGAQEYEVEKVIDRLAGKPIPESPKKIIEDIINALEAARHDATR